MSKSALARRQVETESPFQSQASSKDAARGGALVDPAALLAQARAAVAAGQWEAAIAACERVLVCAPEHGEALTLFAIVARRLGRTSTAESFLLRATCAAPKLARGWQELAGLLAELGRWEEAEASCRRGLEHHPDNAELWTVLGHYHLSHRRDPQAAVQAFEKVVAAHPEAAAAWLNCGAAARRAQQYERAQTCYERLLELSPGHPDGCFNLGNLHAVQARFDQAEACYRQVVETVPDHPEAWRLLGEVRARLGEVEAAREALAEALRRRPDDLAALWAQMRCVPVVYQDTAQIVAERRLYATRLQALARAVTTLPASQRAAMALSVQDNFHVHYAGYDERRTQAMFGGMVHRIMRAALPALARPLPVRADADAAARVGGASTSARPGPTVGREPIRVGFVSSCFHLHTIAKLFSRWMIDLPANRFSTHVFHVGVRYDDVTERLRRASTTFFQQPVVGPHDTEAVARAVRAADLDVLVYPEVGMDVAVLRLAALRLAPMQAMLWGHPVTSGLPTMDVFISSASMEPGWDVFGTTEATMPGGTASGAQQEGAEAQARANAELLKRVERTAQRYYHERLLLLPGMATCINPVGTGLVWAGETIRANPTRASLGVPEDAVVYLCGQSLFKLLPDYDALFARIVSAVPKATVVFLQHPHEAVNRVFQGRLERAFAGVQRSSDQPPLWHMLPRLSQADYLALNRVADVALDSVGWSGGNTTFEALDAGLPIVTWPLELMRSRHTAGILAQAGLSSLVARSADHYVKLAVRLGRDGQFRGAMRDQVRAARPRLFGDPVVLDAWRSWLASARH